MSETDALGGVADRFGTTVESVLQANPFLSPPCFVSPGMRLLMPGNLTYTWSAPSGSPSATGTVRARPSIPRRAICSTRSG